MRRYVFYIAVALFTFGFGLVAAISLYWKADKREFQPPPENTKFYVAEPVFFETNKTLSDGKKEIPLCNDKNLLPLWNELKKDKEFIERIENFNQDEDCAEMLEVQQIDLNGDRRNEFIVWGRSSGLCGGTGNCAVWIYEKKNDKYKLLLQSVAYNDTAKWFEVKKAKSNGYRNILLKSHFTAAETTYIFYKFNGTKYVEDKCLMYRYFSYEKKTSIMTCKEHSEQIEKELRESEKRLESANITNIGK